MPQTAANVSTVPTEKHRGRIREKQDDGRETDRLRRPDGALQQAGHEEHTDDEAGAHGRRIRASDQDEEEHRDEEQASRPFALDAAEARAPSARARPPAPREGPRPRADGRGRPADSARPCPRSSSEVRPSRSAASGPRTSRSNAGRPGSGERRRRARGWARPAPRSEWPPRAFHHPRALDRQPVARPGHGKLAVGGRQVLASRRPVTRTRSPRSAIRATGVSPETNTTTSAGNGRHEAPSTHALGRAAWSAPRRPAAPEIGERAFDDRRRVARRRKRRMRRRGLGGRARDPDGARGESGRQPERRRTRAAKAAPSRVRRVQHAERDGRNDDERRGAAAAARRTRARRKIPRPEAIAARRRRRLAVGEDRPDHAARSSETTASTRWVNAKRS